MRPRGKPLPPAPCYLAAMADKRRFDLFADFLVERFTAERIYDVAGGMGRLNEALSALQHVKLREIAAKARGKPRKPLRAKKPMRQKPPD